MSALAAITREDVGSYVYTLVLVYAILIFIRILLTWIPRVPYNRTLQAVIAFVHDVTDPYLNLFRRVIPPIRMGPAALDVSPMIALFVLFLVGRIVAAAIAG